MDFNKIKQSVSMLSKLIDDNEQISLPIFANKLSKASEIYPQDQTLGVMADVLSRMTSQNKLFISRAEIKDLYNKLYSRNTKFAELFQNELGAAPAEPNIKKYNRDFDDRDGTVISAALDKIVDPTLANALNSAFGNETKIYNKEVADKAKSLCKKSLSNLTANVDVVNGTDSFIICAASFDTPKGKVSIYIPIEIVAEKALLPEIFIGNDGPKNFSKSAIKDYVIANVGKKNVFDDKTIFAALKSIKNSVAEISNVDLALIKLNSNKDAKAELFSTNAILMQKIAEITNKDLKVPEIKDKEIETFASKFDSAAGAASFQFSDSIVNIGRNVIANKLENLGIRNYQISVCDSSNISITYAVSANAGKIAFKVPVKIQKNNVIDPTIIIANANIESFSNDGIKSIIKKDVSDYKTAAIASPLYNLKANELVNIVKSAMLEGNYIKAEDALNVLSTSGDDAAYTAGFNEYKEGLITKQAEPKSKCSNIVKHAHSAYELCGHTGLTLNKVFQDANGDCHPKYRENMTSQGTINSKIFF